MTSKDLVANILKLDGPMPSNVLGQKLSKLYGLKDQAARQRISRHNGQNGVKKLAQLKLPKNSRFMYLQNQYGSRKFWNALVASLVESKSAYGNAILCLRAHGGLMPIDHFLSACGAPIAQKKHLAASQIQSDLLKSHLVTETFIEGVGHCLKLEESAIDSEMQITTLKARLKLEEIVLNSTHDWIRNTALGSANKILIRSSINQSTPKISTFSWDITAPSYLSVFFENGNKKNGFIALDINLTKNLTKDDLLPFLTKCNTLKNLKNVGRCIFIHIAMRYSEDGFKAVREKGYMPLTPESLFGKDISNALDTLLGQLSNMAARLISLSEFESLYHKLEHLNSAQATLRGDLFEVLCFNIAKQYWNAKSALMNHVIVNNRSVIAEVDIVIQTQSRIVIIECKGYKNYNVIPSEAIVRWLTKRIPAIRAHILSNPNWKDLEIDFELWYTGKILPLTLEEIKKHTDSTKKYNIVLRDSNQIETLIRNGDMDNATSTVFKKHFKPKKSTQPIDIIME